MRGVVCVCGSHSFYLLMRASTWACVLFLNMHFVICLWVSFPGSEICLVSQDFQTCWAKRLADPEPRPKAHIWTAFLPGFSCASVGCDVKPVSLSFPQWFLCGSVNVLPGTRFIFWTCTLSQFPRTANIPGSKCLLSGFAGVRSVLETITVLHGVVTVGKHWLSNTGCSECRENWWHRSGQKFWCNGMLDETNVEVDR